ncbi:tetratricopeptide repeat protein [Olivibacter sitiensis]|uniref:tetratricopeptide repeat protein n=1 Tax=Olivibacter sitiensis TaxID=376470 RepID=UPI0004898E9F|nr:tetratricopeptide repeat protein [Olivibacter sitiensis]
MSRTRLAQLLTFKQQQPDDPFILYALASEYLKLNEVEPALFYYNELLIGHPDYVGTYYHLAKLYEALDRKEEAIAVYEKGLAVAQRAGDGHAYSELLAAYKGAKGESIVDEDEDE